MSNTIIVEKHFHKYNINHIYKNMSKTTSKTVTASVKTAKPTGKPTAPAKPSGGKKK